MNQYTFDGCGINGSDEFKTRVLTIAKPEQRNDKAVQAFCKKAAAAEELFLALEAVLKDLDSKDWIHPKSRRTPSLATQQLAREALAKAKGNP